ncbi:MAG: hypothetical protein QOE33_1914 [Acidobacteriota bacterium]|nr:hypothetical protein [Acidobacteriota bacterium]
MDENEVIDAVCTYLIEEGYIIHSRLLTTQRGVDIEAEHSQSKHRLYIEAKGGTSSRVGSNRFGKSYNHSQVFDLSSKGVYAALVLRSKHPDREQEEVRLAAPDTPLYRKYLEPIVDQLNDAGIEILLVDEDRTVVPLVVADKK